MLYPDAIFDLVRYLPFPVIEYRYLLFWKSLIMLDPDPDSGGEKKGDP